MDLVIVFAAEVDLVEVVEVLHRLLVAHVRVRFLLHELPISVRLRCCFRLPWH